VQAAEWLGMKEATLRDWRSRETGPPYIVISPRCVRYDMEDLIKWRNERRRVPSVQAFVDETIRNVALRATARKRST
jgi:Helix-turn-helix domain